MRRINTATDLLLRNYIFTSLFDFPRLVSGMQEETWKKWLENFSSTKVFNIQYAKMERYADL